MCDDEQYRYTSVYDFGGCSMARGEARLLVVQGDSPEVRALLERLAPDTEVQTIAALD